MHKWQENCFYRFETVSYGRSVHCHRGDIWSGSNFMLYRRFFLTHTKQLQLKRQKFRSFYLYHISIFLDLMRQTSWIYVIAFGICFRSFSLNRRIYTSTNTEKSGKSKNQGRVVESFFFVFQLVSVLPSICIRRDGVNTKTAQNQHNKDRKRRRRKDNKMKQI